MDGEICEAKTSQKPCVYILYGEIRMEHIIFDFQASLALRS